MKAYRPVFFIRKNLFWCKKRSDQDAHGDVQSSCCSAWDLHGKQKDSNKSESSSYKYIAEKKRRRNSMEENSNEKDRENLSMEEYLKRRQAVKTRETASRASRGVDSVSALLTAVFYL